MLADQMAGMEPGDILNHILHKEMTFSGLPDAPQARVIAVGLVWNRAGELLFCRMAPGRGVFPGQWGFPGGGLEAGETLEAALRRELREELGIEVANVAPAFFTDGLFDKTFADGTRRPVYMLFLLFHCEAQSRDLTLNEEFTQYRWVTEDQVQLLDINELTVDTLARLGAWEGVRRALAGAQQNGDEGE